MDILLRDLKHSARMLVQAPGFSLAAVAALALGIAPNTAIFSVVNAVLLKPLAYPEPDRVVMFQNTFQRVSRTGTASPAEFKWWRQLERRRRDVSAYTFNVANLTGESFPQQIPTSPVSADFFRLCGAHAVYGRTFTREDDLPNASKTVVLAYPFWRNHYAGDPLVIGRRITLGGQGYEIIGVLGPDLLNGQIAEQSLGSGDIQINQPPDVYVPLQVDPNSTERGHYFNVAGRLKPGVTLAAANEELQASYAEFARKMSESSPGMPGFAITAFAGPPVTVAVQKNHAAGCFRARVWSGAADRLRRMLRSLLLSRANGRRRGATVVLQWAPDEGRIIDNNFLRRA